MYKIILAGLINDKNLGDKIIFESVKFLLTEQLEDNNYIEYKYLDLAEFNSKNKTRPVIIRKLKGAFNRIRRFVIKPNSNKLIQEYCNYYRSQIKDAALIIFVGGGMIKFSTQRNWLYLSGIISLSEEFNIPVVLNAVGVEGFDNNSYKCLLLKKALNSSVVKFVTTRDDIFILNNHYLKNNNSIITKKVADPAVYASDVYKIKKNASSDVVGIGLIRGDIFKEYGINLSKAEVIELYSGLLLELDQRKIKWELFTNGLPTDFELAQEILSKIKKSEDLVNIQIPNSAKNLVEIISKYQGVIAARLHACIISYSLNIPVVGLVWNNKLSFFGKNIGHPERFITYEKFNKSYIIDKMENAINEGYDEGIMREYKNTVRDSIIEILVKNKFIN